MRGLAEEVFAMLADATRVRLIRHQRESTRRTRHSQDAADSIDNALEASKEGRFLTTLKASVAPSTGQRQKHRDASSLNASEVSRKIAVLRGTSVHKRWADRRGNSSDVSGRPVGSVTAR